MSYIEQYNSTIYFNARAIIERQGDAGTEIVLQTRNKAHEGRKTTELPGGRLEPYKSFYNALKREVKEETGLDIVFIEGQDSSIATDSEGRRVECLRPYAVYQTLDGPVDSMGIYLLCRAEGELLSVGDETEDIERVSVVEVAARLAENPAQFSWVDRAALVFYLRERGTRMAA